MSDQTAKKLMIIEFGGKQHIAEPGSRIVVSQPDLKEGDTVEAKDLLSGGQVKLKVTGLFLGKKINGLKFKNKVRYTRRYGHRQSLVTLEVVAAGKPVTEKTELKVKKEVTKKTVKKAVSAKKPAKTGSK